MSFQRRLLLGIGLTLLLAFALTGWFDYQSIRESEIANLKAQAEKVRSTLMATRRVYHRQFMQSGIELTEKTVGFLPAAAMNVISRDFVESWDKTGFRFNNVSDKPRNPRQMADANELKAMAYFREDAKRTLYFEPIREGNRSYYLYARPIWIEPYCLECHGPREKAPPTIQKLYATSYDYQLGELRGLLSIKVPADGIDEAIMHSVRHSLARAGLIMLGLMVVVGLLVRHYIQTPIALLREGVTRLGSDAANARMPPLKGEFRQLADDFNRMVEQLGERTTERDRAADDLRQLASRQEDTIAQRTRDLSEKVQELERTRGELVQAEKMASLGRLVAGFAHEINTPIGVAISGNSGVADKLRELDRLTDSEEVDEQALKRLLRDLGEGAALTGGSLLKAAELVRSFKRTSVDQSSGALRVYDLGESINDVINSLHNKFKRSPIQIAVNCPPGLTLYGAPGTVDQLLTNLLENSYLHAFANGTRAGRIEIGVTRLGDTLGLTFSDDGAGMGEDVLAKIFEPFFTTNRANGGSGLGLYVAYNLVTTRLGGSIVCHSAPGQGTRFEISFPITPAPTGDG